jgi:hypothetical protein
MGTYCFVMGLTRDRTGMTAEAGDLDLERLSIAG